MSLLAPDAGGDFVGRPASPAFSPREFRDAIGQFATGVVVISTELDGHVHAMTANAFMSGSLDPPLVLVSVACTARMHDRIGQSGVFGVSVLASTQLDISDHFANRSVRGVKPLFERLHDLPVIAGAAAQVAATLHHVYPCGGHTLYVGRVAALHLRAERPEPLLFHGGRYGALASPER